MVFFVCLFVAAEQFLFRILFKGIDQLDTIKTRVVIFYALTHRLMHINICGDFKTAETDLCPSEGLRLCCRGCHILYKLVSFFSQYSFFMSMTMLVYSSRTFEPIILNAGKLLNVKGETLGVQTGSRVFNLFLSSNYLKCSLFSSRAQCERNMAIY